MICGVEYKYIRELYRHLKRVHKINTGTREHIQEEGVEEEASEADEREIKEEEE